MNRFVISLVFFLFFSCSNSEKNIDLEISRFEYSLFKINASNVERLRNEWSVKFGSFSEFFDAEIIQRRGLSDALYYNELLLFTSHKDMREAYDSIVVSFSDISKIEDELELALFNFSKNFTSYPIPNIITFFSGFNYGVVTYDNNIAIALESFLGKDSKFYAFIGEPLYLRAQKNRRFISSNVLEVWLNEHFQKYLVGRDLLSQIIYKGKIMFCIDKMLKDVPDADKFRFTSSQMTWVIQNEESIWQYIIHNDLLFSKDEKEFRSLVNYAPFAKGMPAEAPARVAYYIGFQMVNNFMKNNKINMHQLMRLTDSRKFLQQSKYKPTK